MPFNAERAPYRDRDACLDAAPFRHREGGARRRGGGRRVFRAGGGVGDADCRHAGPGMRKRAAAGAGPGPGEAECRRPRHRSPRRSAKERTRAGGGVGGAKCGRRRHRSGPHKDWTAQGPPVRPVCGRAGCMCCLWTTCACYGAVRTCAVIASVTGIGCAAQLSDISAFSARIFTHCRWRRQCRDCAVTAARLIGTPRGAFGQPLRGGASLRCWVRL